jgi:hypothetical protein
VRGTVAVSPHSIAAAGSVGWTFHKHSRTVSMRRLKLGTATLLRHSYAVAEILMPLTATCVLVAVHMFVTMSG